MPQHAIRRLLLRGNNPPKGGDKGVKGEGENAIRRGKPRPKIEQRGRLAFPVVGQRGVTVGIDISALGIGGQGHTLCDSLRV